jgi:hypothetical protein
VAEHRADKIRVLLPREQGGPALVCWRNDLASLAAEGKKKAIVAVAHTLLILVCQVLSQDKPYQENNRPLLDERQRKKLVRHHVRALGRLGISQASFDRSRGSVFGAIFTPRNAWESLWPFSVLVSSVSFVMSAATLRSRFRPRSGRFGVSEVSGSGASGSSLRYHSGSCRSRFFLVPIAIRRF